MQQWHVCAAVSRSGSPAAAAPPLPCGEALVRPPLLLALSQSPALAAGRQQGPAADSHASAAAQRAAASSQPCCPGMAAAAQSRSAAGTSPSPPQVRTLCSRQGAAAWAGTSELPAAAAAADACGGDGLLDSFLDDLLAGDLEAGVLHHGAPALASEQQQQQEQQHSWQHQDAAKAAAPDGAGEEGWEQRRAKRRRVHFADEAVGGQLAVTQEYDVSDDEGSPVASCCDDAVVDDLAGGEAVGLDIDLLMAADVAWSGQDGGALCAATAWCDQYTDYTSIAGELDMEVL